MSTRATYEFRPDTSRAATGTQYEPRPVTLYIHYDGYPEGAATYFYASLIEKNRRGFGVESFIRANDLAEITRSHDAHGDTEYRYTVTGKGPGAKIIAEKFYYGSGDSPRDAGHWHPIFSGTLAAFIDAHGKDIENYSPFREVDLGDYCGKAWHNLITARERMEGEHGALPLLRTWKSSPRPDVRATTSSNWQSVVSQLAAMVEAFPELATDEIRELIATKREPVTA